MRSKRQMKYRSRKGRTLKMTPGALVPYVLGHAARYAGRKYGPGIAAGLGAASVAGGYAATRKYDPVTHQRSYNAGVKSVTKTSDRIQEDIGTGGDVTRSSVKFALGRKLSKAKQTHKLLKSSEQKVVNIFRGINPFLGTAQAPFNNISTELGAGAYWLHNYTSNTTYYLPVHMYDLTSTNNVINGVVTTYNPSFQLTASNNIFTFSNMKCEGPQSSFQAQWMPENVPGATTGGTNYPNKRSLIESVNVKMYCYGANSNATQWDVSLIQLKDDVLHPNELVRGDIVPTGRELIEKDSFYQYLSSKQTAHPINTLDPNNRKKYKVLKSFNFVLQPRLTNEVETLPHQKELNIWIPMNRICKWDWSDTVKSANNESVYYWQQSTGQVDCVVNPRARIYLLVRATNTTITGSPSVETYQTTPSYDLVIRQKQIIVE